MLTEIALASGCTHCCFCCSGVCIYVLNLGSGWGWGLSPAIGPICCQWRMFLEDGVSLPRAPGAFRCLAGCAPGHAKKRAREFVSFLMNSPLHVLMGLLFWIASAAADEKSIPTYVTSKEIEAVPPCTGTFSRISEYAGSFTTAEGKRFILGSPTGEQWVWHFLGTLKDGQNCKLPEAYLNYINAPLYETAAKIAAMPSCTATLVERSPCSAFFRMADGRGFYIGDPGSGVQISQFLWSLKEGTPCKLPQVFLEYQKQHPKVEN